MDALKSPPRLEVRFRRLRSRIRIFKNILFGHHHRNSTPTTAILDQRPMCDEVASPFMKLPVEVRLLIYSYLMPDMVVHAATMPGKALNECLRFDRKPCCPALLRTNRTVHHELVEQWYRSARYCILLEDNALRFADQEFSLVVDLPFGFRFLRRLDLTIHFIRYGSLESLKERGTRSKSPGAQRAQKEALQHLELLEGISNYFSPSGPGNLQDLKLYINCGPQYFRDYVLGGDGHHSLPAAERQALIWKGLKFNLHPLRNIRVSGNVHLVEHWKTLSMMGCSGEVKDDVIAVKMHYFRRLELKIIGAYD